VCFVAKSPGHYCQGRVVEEPLAVLEIRTRAAQVFASVAFDQGADLGGAVGRGFAVRQPALQILHQFARVEPLDFESGGGEQSEQLGGRKRAGVGIMAESWLNGGKDREKKGKDGQARNP
jgi:hypothetical protein